MKTQKIPPELQAVLWSADINKLDLEKDKGYIMHQVLCFGTFPQIKWLFSIYPKQKVTNEFTNHPIKMYPRYVFYFVKNYLLDLKNRSLDEHDYTTSIHGPVRQRTANSIS